MDGLPRYVEGAVVGWDRFIFWFLEVPAVILVICLWLLGYLVLDEIRDRWRGL